MFSLILGTRAIAIYSGMPPASVGTQIIVAVVVGLFTAFAVQFLLTNLGLVLGLWLLKYRPQASSKQAAEDSEDISVDIGFFAGLGILFTLNLVLFIACFLAVRFSTTGDSISGATLGIVIWSTYFLILIWASYSAVGWVFGTLTTKLRQLIDAIANWISGTDEPSELLTEEATANLINQEIKTALSEFDLQQRIEDYLKTLPSPQLDLSAISQGFADLIAQLNLESFAETNLLKTIDRQTFINLIDERTNLATSEIEQIVDRLERIWQQAVERYEKQDLNGELIQVLQSANPEELQFEQLVKRLEQLIGQESKRNSTDSDERTPQLNEVEIDSHSNSVIKSWSNLNWKAIKNALLKRVDLSEIELEDVWHTLQFLYQHNPSEASLKLSFNTISNDIEDYLWHTPPWYLNSEKGWQEFKRVIYDPEADPIQVRSQLKQVKPADFVALLQQRDDLDAQKIEGIVEHLETVRQEVFSLIEEAEFSEQKQALCDRLRNYLQTAKLEELQEDNLLSSLEQSLIKSGMTTGVLTQFLNSWQQLQWQSWLQQRQDLEPDELQQIEEQLDQIGDRLRAKFTDWQFQVTSTAQELQSKLESYLRYTNQDLLTPEKIANKLEQLGQEARDNLPEIEQLPEIDLSSLSEILKRRKGFGNDQIKAISTQIETHWQQLNGSATPEISPLQTKSSELVENVVDYLYQAIKQNLNLTDIEAGLPQLFDDAKSATTTQINQQLDRLDWHEIEAKLKQVKRGRELQIQQTIKQLRNKIRQLAKLPRRWATRTSKQVSDVVDELEAFLSHSNKIELTAEHLEHNLKGIFHRVKTWSNLQGDTAVDNLDRLAKLTPANFTQPLAARQDITPVEIEQISVRSVAIIDRLSQEIKTQQEQTNQLVQHLLKRLGEYFSSLNLWYLDYNYLKDSLANFDFQSLTDSWQETIAEIPLTELGDRLGQLSHETLSTIIQTKEILPNMSLSPIQGIQDYIAQQIETIQLTAYERTEAVKQKTLQQIEATRKAIATAAYWMLAIAFSSIVTSVLAGFLATTVNF